MFKFLINKILSRKGFADPLTLAAVALGVICVSFLCANYVVVNNDTFNDFSDMGDAYVDWARENRPDILNRLAENIQNNSYDYRGLNPHWAGNLYSGPVIGVLCDIATYKDIVASIHDFLSSIGSFTPSGDLSISYDSGIVDYTNLYNLAVSLYQSYYGVSSVNRYFSDSNWGVPALIDNGNRPYITFVGGINYSTNDSPQFFGAIASPTKFLDIVERSNGRYKVASGCRVIVWTPSDNDAHGEYSYGFDLSHIQILGNYYYDPAADTPTTDKTYTATDSGREFAQNPVNYADTSADSVAQDVITHYGDGRADVKEKVTFAFPITGTYPSDFAIDEDSARDIPYSDVLTDSPTDYYTEDTPSDTVDNTSVWSKILAFINGFWDGFVNGILKALRDFFLPHQEFTERMIADIRQAFIDKFGYTDFDFEALFGEAFEPQDFYLTDYSAGGLSAVTAKIVDVSFLKTAALRFRSLIRAIISLMLLLYNLNQLMHFIGQAGVSLGFWESGEDNSLPVDIRGFLSRGGHFRKD